MTQGLRSGGWTVQVLEQFAHSILIRPFILDTGPAPRECVPMERRG